LAELKAAGKARKAGVRGEAKGRRGPTRPKVGGKGRAAGRTKDKVKARRR